MKRFGEEEERAVQEVIRSGKLSEYFQNPRGGPKVQEFEEAFAKYHGVEHAIAVSSGTAALHAALLACRPTDSVYVPALSFIASASSILMTGARPIFVDVNRTNYNIEPNIYHGTVMPVHLLGNPAEAEGQVVIEDCAQALGARLHGQLVGTRGDAGCFSFQFTKTITTAGEGGMIITGSDKIAEKCRQIRSHGSQYQESPFLTYNFRMTEVQAAFGIEQLRKLDRFNDIQVRNARYIIDHLPQGILRPGPYSQSVFMIVGCTVDEEELGMTRHEYIGRLTVRGVNQIRPGRMVSLGYKGPLYRKPLLRPYEVPCPNAEWLCEHFLFIDIHRWRELEEVKADVEIMHEVLRK